MPSLTNGAVHGLLMPAVVKYPRSLRFDVRSWLALTNNGLEV